MLDMGFIDDIRFILSKAGKGARQTMLFSATMPAEILKLSREHMKGDAREVRLNREEATLDSIDQSYLLVEENQKLNQLVAIIKPLAGQQVIVFAATKARADRIASSLKGSGFRASAIHGDRSQKERDMVMSRFRKGAEAVLVATDVASRGIDVPAVSHVINYDVPGEQDTYFHRIGRTARAGAKGTAVTLVTPDRFSDFERIMRRVKTSIKMLNESMGLAVPAIRQGEYGFHRRGASSKKWNKQAPFARIGPRRPWEKKSRRYGNNRQFRK
jgi:ATP-dependent RNA helicase DeaD